MIFGKTNIERFDERQRRLKLLSGKRHKRFAFIPVQVNNGKFVWLGYYWLDYNIYKTDCRYEKGSYKIRYLHEFE